ncbi:sodium-dependent transporter [Haloplanus halobius]|uniref:sodium-dependent transporter n=1 Tax=Haloplanus halobius TaxID=2934938 RepID=UPI00200D107A|nr:sodium-dependent transporter [Haloplanus sp. XH21]
MSQRETWATRVGFILAAVGSAVGLGNVWQFPFQTGANGGAAFIVVYLLAVFLIGFPAMLAEFVIGRRAERNPIDAFARLGHRNWRVVGILGTLSAFWILAFYSVVGGWVIRYIIGSVRGAYFSGSEAYFGAVSAGPEAVAFHALFMAITVGIVAFGIAGGIERSTKLMVPSIVLLLGGLAIWATTLDGGGAGYAYYLSPDVDTLVSNIGSILPAAVGQAFFTLSLGMGAMITYASYLGRDDSLPIDGATIVVLNTFVGLLAGLVVFPILFSLGIEPGSGGLGAAFITLAGAFAQLPAGRLLGAVFFIVLLLAALSSAISLLEVVTSYLADNTSYSRPALATALGGAIFALGIPSAFGLSILAWYNAIAYNLLLPLSVLTLLVFVGWVDTGDAVAELRRGTGLSESGAVAWLWFVRTIVPLGVLVTLLLGLQTLAVDAGLLAEAIV